MKWMVPERLLDENQLDILRKCGGIQGHNQWIQGFAGSGKTALVVHAAQRLLAADENTSVCIVTFTHALKDLIQSGIEAKYHIPVMTCHQLLREKRRYDVVFVDEVQDISSQNLENLKSLADRLIVAGDIDQSIYDSSSSPEEIMAALQPDTHLLQVVHRLTRRLISIVKTILPNTHIEGARTGRMEEVQVTLARADTKQIETQWVWERCSRYSKTGEPSAILLPNHQQVQTFMKIVAEIENAPTPDFLRNAGQHNSVNYQPANDLFEEVGIPLQYLGNKYGRLGDSDRRSLTYVMTYHSAKGLDFKTVFLPYLDSDQVFWHKSADVDRRLFFVAATRSRRNLFLSYSSQKPHPYVQGMPQNLLHMEKCELKKNESTKDEQDIFF